MCAHSRWLGLCVSVNIHYAQMSAAVVLTRGTVGVNFFSLLLDEY
jgi:hypothetical protein